MYIPFIAAFVIVATFVLLRVKRNHPAADVKNDTFTISCSRPSQRSDIHCWLMNVSIRNSLQIEVRVNKIFVDIVAPENEYRGIDSELFNEKDRVKILEQVHHILKLPLQVEKGSSLIRIAVLPMRSENEFGLPEKRKLLIESSRGMMEFPLFKL
jgi:hypothetical protein